MLTRKSLASIRRKAEAAPGVLCVLTGADALAEGVGPMFPLMPEDMGGPKGFRAPRFLLASGKVRYAGERVAFVVAETLAQAQDAAELVDVSYEPLSAVTEIEGALKDGAPKIWDECPTGNLVFAIMMGSKEATDAAFAKAAHKISLRMVNNRISANSMETRGYIGDYSASDDFYTLYTTTQNPHGARGTIAGQVFHVPESQVRVIAKDVGGGFGMKGDVYPEEALVLWASRKIGRPVKWISSRSEGLLTDTHGRDQIVTGEIALDKDGTILGLRAHSLTNLGGNISGAGVIPSLSALQMAPQVYRIPTIFFTGRAAFTNTAPMGPYRGAGRPEATYFMERMIEHAAQATGIDRVELRRRNFVPASAMPFTSATGVVYDSGDFADTMNKTIARADWDGYGARKTESESKGRLRGRGLIYYVETCGIFNDRMELRFDPSGSVTIVAGTFISWPGSRHHVYPDGVGLARCALREHPLRSRRHQPSVVRPWHLWFTHLVSRWWRAQSGRCESDRKGQEPRRPFNGSRAGRHPVRQRPLYHCWHRQIDGARRCCQSRLRADDVAAGIRTWTGGERRR